MADWLGELLIAEDDPQSARLLCEMLEAAGYQSRAVHDGDALLAAVAETPPDLILLDVRIPGRNGFEVCEELKSDPATTQIPVIMVTGFTGDQWRLRAIEAGADDFLTKPVKRAELYARIRALLRMRAWAVAREDPAAVVQSLFTLIELADPALAAHSRQVANLAAAAARHSGVDGAEVQLLSQAALLHDLGKVTGGPATEHPIRGEKALAPLGPLNRLAPLIRGHHERYDGLGFPDALPASAQPFLLQVLTAANAWAHILEESPNRVTASAELRKQIAAGWWNPSLKEPLLQAAEEVKP